MYSSIKLEIRLLSEKWAEPFIFQGVAMTKKTWVSWRLPKHRVEMAFASVFAVSCLGILGCGDDCRKKIQGGDFEMSQGNYSRAVTLFDQAKAAGGCPDAAEKWTRAKELLDHKQGQAPSP
jgi:hypothetical protein